jgi:succinate dehydrogenase flavin-adding protein (antitoxin of CptAB toxin-antitoxin module)
VKDERRLDRLRWKARRGLLENDLLLRKFLAVELTQLNDAQLQTFDQLLQLGDNDLLELLMGRRSSERADFAALIVRIQRASMTA